jgi:hypothetical protein
MVSDRMFGATTAIEEVNRTNPDTELDRADTVRVSLSQGLMTWRDRSWPVVGSAHTPRGRFRIGEARSGKDFMIPDSPYFLPFRALPIAQMPRSNPQYQAAQRSGAAMMADGIHKNNLRPGQVGAGCLLVSEGDLLDVTQLVQGATIVITD